MEENNRNIWIIAFSFPPNKRVGAMRAGYWAKAFPEALQARVKVFTAEENALGEGLHFVRKSGRSIFTKLIADDGLIWKKNIQQYLEKHSLESPDVVIITGGPFMHFGLSSWLKKKYSCKVILDYRDPFAINPLFKNSWIKVKVKQYFEKRFNAAADGLITVNEYCGKIIQLFQEKPSVVAQNGYDETVQQEAIEVNFQQALSFVYAGKFYANPGAIQEAIIQEKVKLNYIGPDDIQLDLQSEFIESQGFVDYSKALDVIGKSDVGIIQTSGHVHLSTTKIFDYMRCERAILIVSEDKLYEGSIHDELQGYPNVFWTKNNSADIARAIQEIKAAKYQSPPPNFAIKYSRKYQLKPVIHLIEQLLK